MTTNNPHHKSDIAPSSAAASVHRDDRKQFFNDRAENWTENCYPEHVQGTGRETEKKINRLLSLIPFQTGDTVADLGCGTGILVHPLLERIGKDGHLIEIDYAEEMVRVNQQNNAGERISFLAEDVMNLSLDTASCNVALAFSCFPHFDDQQKALEEINRILCPGGILAVAHFDSSEELNNFHQSTHPAVMSDKLPDPNTLARMAEETGFEILQGFEEPGFYFVSARSLQS